MARATTAFAGMGALVAGLPLLLVRLVGNPFPAEVPSIDEIRILLTQNGQGFTNFVIGTLAVIIWCIWAQLVVSLCVEVAATIRQTETRRLPTLPGIQTFAARLVASITLATTLATAPLLAPAVGALTFDEAAVGPPASSLAMTSDEFSGATVDAAGSPLVLVRGMISRAPRIEAAVGDTPSASFQMAEQTELWDLAEAAYGDGISWKLIAQANAGLSDANGAMITSDTEAVAAGTELLLPGSIDTQTLGTFVATADPTGAAVHVVEPGDSMWTVAQHEVERRLDRSPSDGEVGRYWADVVAANQDVSSGDVDLIYPGEELVLPADVATVPESESESESESETETESEAEAAVEPEAELVDGAITAASALVGVVDGPADNGQRSMVTDPNATAEPELAASSELDAIVSGPASAPLEAADADTSTPGGRVSAPAVGMAAMGAAILSAGVVGALRRRRDLQRRTRPAGAIGRPASAASAAFEAALVHSSHELRESQIGLGWRLLPAAALASLRSAGPLELHADDSGRLTAVPLVDTGTALEVHRVDLDPAVAVDTVAKALGRSAGSNAVAEVEVGTAAVPTTTVIGTEASSGEAVLLDLASVGILNLRGETSAIRRVARGVVLDLAVSDRCDDLCVIGVDVGCEIDDLERVHSVSSFSEALAQVLRCGHAGPHSTTPVVVVSATAPAETDDSVMALRELRAMVVAPGVEAVAQLDIEGDRATLLPAGTIVTLAAFDEDNYRSVTELVDTTSATAIEIVDSSEPVDTVLDIVASASCPVEAGPVEVKVLGPVTVMGAGSFSSLKAVDVVAYLAFHRHGVDADQIKSWVWPAFDPPTDKAFANVMSRARTGLGADPEGAPFLSRAGADKTYRLAEAVTTDFDRFRAMVDLADAAEASSAALDLLKQAIELIRGVPFTGGAASSFTWADNHVRARVEYTIDESVHRCVDLALDIGDLTTARWAVLKGLELVPGCEQCFRRRFLIASAGKNRSELRRAMADLEASAMIDLGEPEAVDMISGDLLDLYRELDRALVAGPA